MSDLVRTYASVAKDLGVNRETLRLWVREARSAGTAGKKAATPGKRPPAGPVTSGDVLEEENKQLRARIRELELPRDGAARNRGGSDAVRGPTPPARPVDDQGGARTDPRPAQRGDQVRDGDRRERRGDRHQP
ncbi:transposase [Sphaerimonospora thailandensis]|uniref:Transposase n=1 Tax=Sphaerimonospora thailandensis TaxID=795644 RepID=A0A8J3RDU3_9ACTN|nr:transposase [Sphaerimonospora thailandensis]GIH72027.1 hypothetical protein Mth01_42800 [Sphaerimonospora thailandensis]